MNGISYLTIIVFLPLAGGLLCLLPSRTPGFRRWTALTATSIELLLAIGLFWKAGPAGAGSRWLLAVDRPWIEPFGIRYSLGLDGISLALILLTAFLMLLCVLVSWRQVDQRVGLFHFLLLVVETGIIGVFLATDLFLFYLFWELQTIPIFLLIALWGHGDRIKAAVKFVLFTFTGSLLMLVSLITLHLYYDHYMGQATFDLFRLSQIILPPKVEIWLFAGFILAFAIKAPVFPFHSWLPDAHTQAPTAGSVILAGLLLKTGTYAILRIAFPLFPGSARSVRLYCFFWASSASFTPAG